MGPSGDSACANSNFRSLSLSRPRPVDKEVVELRVIVRHVPVDVTITAAGTEVVIVTRPRGRGKRACHGTWPCG